MYNMAVFIVLLVVIFIHDSDCKFIKKRPNNGIGRIMVSMDDKEISTDDKEIHGYNKERVLIIFNITCIDLQINDTMHDHTENEMKIEEMEVLEDNIEFILDTYSNFLSGCNSSNTSNEATFHIETKKSSVAFFNYNEENNNIDNIMDYDELCIDYIMYEPLFELETLETFDEIHKQQQDTKHTCNNIKISNNEQNAKYGLDLLTSVNYERNYLYPNIANSNSNSNSNVDIYILDSGIRSSHEEFADNNIDHYHVSNGAVNEVTTGIDVNGHGSHVAGIMGGKNYGISKKLNIFDYRIADINGTIGTLDILDALEDILFKLKNNKRRGVINLSLGSINRLSNNNILHGIYFGLFEEIIAYGGIPVVAAGNSNDDSCHYAPSRSGNAITVGSFNKNRRKSGFSNYGECVDIWAAGDKIHSSYNQRDNQYAELSGTSMAAPYITGVVANLLMVNNDLTFETINKILLNGAAIIIDGVCGNNINTRNGCYGAVYDCNAVWDNSNTLWKPPVFADDSVYALDETDDSIYIVIAIVIVIFVCLCICGIVIIIIKKKQKVKKLNLNHEQLSITQQ